MIHIENTAVDGQQTHFERTFPLVLQCRTASAELESVCRWIAENASDLVARAAQQGAILFRGFPLATAEDFDLFVSAFGLENFPYDRSLSNAVRINRTPRVFTANEAPPDVTIFLHHEMAQTPIYPSRLFFFCEQPAACGGETPICRSDVLLERLREQCPEFVRACEEKGLKYSNVMPPAADLQSGMGRSWQETFRVGSREAAEQRMRQLGYTWQWQPDDCLRATTPTLPAVRTLAGGRKSFFNQLIAAFKGWKDARNNPAKAITFGDGTPLDAGTVQHAAQIADQITFDIPWQQGDVALVDNFVALHGRRSFQGTRKVLASLVL